MRCIKINLIASNTLYSMTHTVSSIITNFQRCRKTRCLAKKTAPCQIFFPTALFLSYPRSTADGGGNKLKKAKEMS